MKHTLTFIEGKITANFSKHSDAIWLPVNYIDKLLGKPLGDNPCYVRISCQEPLKEFVIYSKIACLNTKSDDQRIYINPSLLPKSNFLDLNTQVSIEHQETEELTTASSITIELPKEEVVTWSKDESSFGINYYKSSNEISFYGQKMFFRSGTHKLVLGNVTKIYPEVSKDKAVCITKDTIIHLEGLPENQQKVIDFSKIGGLNHIIQRLREIIQVPLLYPELLERFDIEPPKGLLLYGPPGNGKTLIAKTIAYSLGSAFIAIEGSELNSKYVGEGERKLREKFEEASKHKHCVIFIDEIDAVASDRDIDGSTDFQISIVSTLLNLMDGIGSAYGVFVIGATNRLDVIDQALRRPGRFELEYEITLPDRIARLDILQKNIPLEKRGLLDSSISKDLLEHLSVVTNGYSGADLISLYRLSVMEAFKRYLIFDVKTGKVQLQSEEDVIQLKDTDIHKALKQITPTSLRGIDTSVEAKPWHQVIDIGSFKKRLEDFNTKLKTTKKKVSNNRFSFTNILVKGNIGSGKKTLFQSFATHFNYEWIHFNALDHIGNSFPELVYQFERKLQRCKQVAPAVLYIEHIEYISEIELFTTKLKSVVAQINNNYQVLVVVAIQKIDDATERLFKGYKGFNNFLEFSSKITPRIIQTLATAFNLDIDSLEKWEDSEVPIGEIIYEIEESLIHKI